LLIYYSFIHCLWKRCQIPAKGEKRNKAQLFEPPKSNIIVNVEVDETYERNEKQKIAKKLTVSKNHQPNGLIKLKILDNWL